MKKLLSLSVFLLCFCAATLAQKHHTPFYENMKAPYSKRMRDVFSNLDQGRYAEADYERVKLINESAKKQGKSGYADTYIDAVQPLWDLSAAMIMLNPHFQSPAEEMAYNPERAYSLVVNILRTDFHVKDANAFLQYSLGHSRITVQHVKQQAEEALLAKARERKMESVYDKYIDMLYQSPLLGTFRSEREAVAFVGVMKTNTLSEYNRYVNKYGSQNPDHLHEVEVAKEELEYQAVGDNADQIQRFLSLYPKSAHREELTASLYKVEYDKISPGFSDSDCRWYLRNYPKSPYADKLRKLLDDRQKQRDHDALIQEKRMKHYNHCYQTFNGKLVKEVETQTWMGTGSSVAYVENAYYDHLGLLVRTNSSRSGEVTYEYDNDPRGGLYISRVVDTKNGSFTVTPVVSDADNIVELHFGKKYVEYLSYDSDHMLTARIVRQLDKNGQDVTYTYRNGREFSQKKGGIELRHVYNENNCVERSSKMRNGTVMENMYFTYEYDAFGNWTSMVQRDDNGNVIARKVRHIEYR